MSRARASRQRYSHSGELSRLYREREELVAFERDGSIDPAWVKKRLRKVSRAIDAELAKHPGDLSSAIAELDRTARRA